MVEHGTVIIVVMTCVVSLKLRSLSLSPMSFELCGWIISLRYSLELIFVLYSVSGKVTV